jgi:hypothetical protein
MGVDGRVGVGVSPRRVSFVLVWESCERLSPTAVPSQNGGAGRRSLASVGPRRTRRGKALIATDGHPRIGDADLLDLFEIEEA